MTDSVKDNIDNKNQQSSSKSFDKNASANKEVIEDSVLTFKPGDNNQNSNNVPMDNKVIEEKEINIDNHQNNNTEQLDNKLITPVKEEIVVITQDQNTPLLKHQTTDDSSFQKIPTPVQIDSPDRAFMNKLTNEFAYQEKEENVEEEKQQVPEQVNVNVNNNDNDKAQEEVNNTDTNENKPKEEVKQQDTIPISLPNMESQKSMTGNRPDLSVNQDDFMTAIPYSEKTVTNNPTKSKKISIDDGFYTAMEPSEFNGSRRPTDIFEQNRPSEENTRTQTDNVDLNNFRESDANLNKDSLGRHTFAGGNIKMDLDGLMVEDNNKKPQKSLD